MSKKKGKKKIEIEIPIGFFTKFDKWTWTSILLTILIILSIITKGFGGL